MRFPFFGQFVGGMLLLFVAGCGLFKKQSDVVVPERVLEVGESYQVEENTPFFIEGVEDAEPDRYLAGGSTVHYIGPGLSQRSAMVRVGDGMEGFVDSNMLTEKVPSESTARRQSRPVSEPKLPVAPSDSEGGQDSEIPRIRIENPMRIAPRPIQPKP